MIGEQRVAKPLVGGEPASVDHRRRVCATHSLLSRRRSSTARRRARRPAPSLTTAPLPPDSRSSRRSAPPVIRSKMSRRPARPARSGAKRSTTWSQTARPGPMRTSRPRLRTWLLSTAGSTWTRRRPMRSP